MENAKAKVFLSCGQRGDSETECAGGVRRAIIDCGFDCYMAVEQQSLRSLRDNIFREIETSDYFVFVDFARERLDGGQRRGSTFVNQELAIASFLNLPVLAFQEKGLLPLDGLLGAIQCNVEPFGDRDHLDLLVTKRIHDKMNAGEWAPRSHNSLTLSACPETSDAKNVRTGVISRYSHVLVRNNHARKPARECFVYLESVENLQSGELLRPETVEFKWAGSRLPSVRIGPEAGRRFDAFHFPIVPPEGVREIGFNVLTDSTDFYPWQLNMPGRYRLVFTVVSQDFPEARGSFVLEYGETLNSIRFAEG